MKKIVCELCEGTDFVKDGGMFVCQGCGTKYTAEEAKSMMREVEGAVPITTGSPVASVSMSNPNQQQIENLLLLAANAFSADNIEKAEEYCNKAIEYDALCYKAWFLKGKAVGWSSTAQNSRIAEAAHCFKQAIDFAPDEEKGSLTDEATEEWKQLGLACIALRQERFSEYLDKEELYGFVLDTERFVDGLAVLLSKKTEVAKKNALFNLLAAKNGESIDKNDASQQFLRVYWNAKALGLPEEFFSRIATMMGNAALEGFNTAKANYAVKNHPMESAWRKTMSEVDNCITLSGMARTSSGGETADDIERCNNEIAMEEYIIGMTFYATDNSFYKIGLPEASKTVRREIITIFKQKIQEIEYKIKSTAEEERKKNEEEKQARIVAYWETHRDEKEKLDSEKKWLEGKKKDINSQMADVDAQINAAQPTGNVPSEDESNKVKEQIKELEKQRSGLGIFAGKEKKRISEEITSLQSRVNSLKTKIEEEKKSRTAETEKKTAPLKAKKDELEKQLSPVTKRLSAIENELTKDPEE